MIASANDFNQALKGRYTLAKGEALRTSVMNKPN